MKIGIVGLGHLGKIHLKCLRQLPNWHVVGFVDIDPDVKDDSLTKFPSLEDMLPHCDAVDIITPTLTHYEIITKCLKANKHIFVEKPMCANEQEANLLIEQCKNYPKIFQIGHVERFNPAFLAVKDTQIEPLFIEVHRLANYSQRGTDVSVVLDLMIHDLDIILHLVKSKVTNIQATGVTLLSRFADICNARIQFENGCVANITASRISLNPMRKIRIFQPDAYVSMDFLSKSTQIIRIENVHHDRLDDPLVINTDTGAKKFMISMPESPKINAIQEQLREFYNSILTGKQPKVGIKQAAEAIKLADDISICADKNVSNIKSLLKS